MSPQACPSWCANRIPDFPHRGRVYDIGEVHASLYADADTPDLVTIDLVCDSEYLDPRTAFALGRLLITLSKVANSNSVRETRP